MTDGQQFLKFLSDNGLPAPQKETLQQLAQYAEMLQRANTKTNLTAVGDRAGIWQRHFADSAAVLLAGMTAGTGIIDVGCGAGFPGLPVKILCDSTQLGVSLTLCDSRTKKIDFVQSVVQTLQLENVTCIAGRAEELGRAHSGILREYYDLALSRAVAPLSLLAEMCLPLVRVGGRMIAMKSAHSGEELDRARRIIGALGGGAIDTIDYRIGEDQPPSRLIVIHKASPSPDEYPRKWKKIVGDN